MTTGCLHSLARHRAEGSRENAVLFRQRRFSSRQYPIASIQGVVRESSYYNNVLCKLTTLYIPFSTLTQLLWPILLFQPLAIRSEARVRMKVYAVTERSPYWHCIQSTEGYEDPLTYPPRRSSAHLLHPHLLLRAGNPPGIYRQSSPVFPPFPLHLPLLHIVPKVTEFALKYICFPLLLISCGKGL